MDDAILLMPLGGFCVILIVLTVVQLIKSIINKKSKQYRQR